MEITCPSCGTGFETSGNENILFCPACGAELLVEDKEEGFLLVSVVEPGEEHSKIADPDEPSAEHDPIMADFTLWRHGGLFALLLGAVGILMVCLATFHDYSNYGKTFVMNSGNRLFLAGAAVFLGLLVAAGSIIYIYAGKERRRYVESWRANPVKVEHPPKAPGPY